MSSILIYMIHPPIKLSGLSNVFILVNLFSESTRIFHGQVDSTEFAESVESAENYNYLSS